MYSIHTFLLQKELFRSSEPVKTTVVSSFTDTSALQQIARQADSDYILFYTGTSPIELHPYAIGRMYQIAESNDGALFYSDYQEIRQGKKIHHPTLEYQTGSIRNDFDFGQLLLFRNDSFQQVVAQMNTDYRFAALYELRLSISRLGKIVHIPETLYTVQPTDLRLSGEKQFDYVDPANREVQLEMEAVCTAHLQAIGAWLAPEFQRIDFGQENFAREASVIIPVRNRKRTIAEAVESALQQQTDFSFNVIVVDNHSTDGTGQILTELSRRYPNLIHHIPASTELGIGGCWTEAILLPECGKFAIQLDSDDLYKDCHVLQRIVDTFYQENCAMVIGSYQMVDFKLEEIPPGLIAHREWTPDNGRNNALRINGLGAPRAFYTPVLRQIKFPNVSYGEDYATALAISRKYPIARIYDPLYLCRRWEENSDHDLDIQQLNNYNFYKDKIRTLEIQARISGK